MGSTATEGREITEIYNAKATEDCGRPRTRGRESGRTAITSARNECSEALVIVVVPLSRGRPKAGLPLFLCDRCVLCVH